MLKCISRQVTTRDCSGSAAEHFSAAGSSITSAGFSPGLYS